MSRLAIVGALAMVAVAASAVDAAVAPAATGCEDVGNTEPAVDGFPGRMSTLVGNDIRTGAHECFERVVLEFEGTGELPGYAVGYEPDPIVQSPSGAPVEIAGDATLIVSVGAWMPDMERNGYGGPTQISPTNVTNILELRQIENFEGQTQWAIGLDRERDFAVTTLADPTRIVIDIALDQAAPPATTTSPPVTTPTTSPPVTTATPPVTPQPPATTAPPASTQPPTTTPVTTPSTTAPPGAEVTPENHLLVGAWLVVDDAEPESPPQLGAFTSDGIYHQADADGVDGYGTWEPTGPTSAALTFVQLNPDAGAGIPASATIRASIEVDPDGRSFTADYTIQLSGENAPSGQYGPGSVTATRIEVEPMATPAGSIDDLFAALSETTTPPTTTPS